LINSGQAFKGGTIPWRPFTHPLIPSQEGKEPTPPKEQAGLPQIERGGLSPRRGKREGRYNPLAPFFKGDLSPGEHEYEWDARGMASG